MIQIATRSLPSRNPASKAHPALVRVDRIRQPGVADPSPPHHSEDEHPVKHTAPRRVVRQQVRDLRDREHEHEVEETARAA
jgi:hypothetical protein